MLSIMRADHLVIVLRFKSYPKDWILCFVHTCIISAGHKVSCQDASFRHAACHPLLLIVKSVVSMYCLISHCWSVFFASHSSCVQFIDKSGTCDSLHNSFDTNILNATFFCRMWRCTLNLSSTTSSWALLTSSSRLLSRGVARSWRHSNAYCALSLKMALSPLPLTRTMRSTINTVLEVLDSIEIIWRSCRYCTSHTAHLLSCSCHLMPLWLLL